MTDLDILKKHIAAGHSVYELSRLSGVSRTTIQSWLFRGLPSAVESVSKVMDVVKKKNK